MAGRRAGAGIALALGAAATFGVLAPAGKGALGDLAPLRGAGLAYLAAGAVALGTWSVARGLGATHAGRPLARSDGVRLLGMTVLGGMVGPACFFQGLALVTAHHAAVVQHLEFALTVVAAVIVLGERPGRRGIVGLLLVFGGVLLLSLAGADTRAGEGVSLAGLAWLVAACIAWAADNTLARGASDLDPLVVVSIKGLGAGALLTILSVGGGRPPGTAGWTLVVLAGGVGVGLSLVLELLALRRIGAALNAGLFATGPAFGFVWSLLFLGEHGGAIGWLALAACLAGAVFLATDRHEHVHAHAPIRHRHRHHHLDGHHGHDHGPGFDPRTAHEHEHEHEAVVHAHSHVHDDHHRHRHHKPERRGEDLPAARETELNAKAGPGTPTARPRRR